MKIVNVFILAAVFLVACGKDEIDIDAQRTRIVNYLAGREYDYTEQNGVYKYTFHAAQERSAIAEGDSAYIYFSGYIFANAPGAMFTTNIAADTVRTGMETAAMNFTPRGIKVGDGTIAGIGLGLPGSREGDSLMLFLTSDLAYGSVPMGSVAAGSAVAFKIVVDKVVK